MIAIADAAYDRQVRTALAEHLPAGRRTDWDGPLLRMTGGFRGFVGYRDLAGLTGPDLDALIERTIDYFDARAEPFEWKWHAHDEPADLTDRLLAHGFVPEELETVLVGGGRRALTERVPPDGVEIRELTTEPPSSGRSAGWSPRSGTRTGTGWPTT